MTATTVAVAGGKGGTGKTTVAASLALEALEDIDCVQLLDCDVEAPNAHLLFNPVFDTEEDVRVPVPQIDESKCEQCGKCAQACEFNALVSLKTRPLVFPELCHGCGACVFACPNRAISETERKTGVVRNGRAGKLWFTDGLLTVGEAMSPPVISAVKRKKRDEGLVIIDCPPGASCPAVEAMRGADFVILVTEPTPFGLNDLHIVLQAVRQMKLPALLVVNKAAEKRADVAAVCKDCNIEIVGEIPEDRNTAQAYSRGIPARESSGEMRTAYRKLFATVRDIIGKVG